MSGHGGFPINPLLVQRAAKEAAESNLGSGLDPDLTGFSLLFAKVREKFAGTFAPSGTGPGPRISGMKGFRLFFGPNDVPQRPEDPKDQLDETQLRDLMARLALRMYRPYAWGDSSGPGGAPSTPEIWENPDIPSGYTYLLQLVAHDLVASSFSLAVLEELTTGATNTRSSALRLDTIYGGGPAVCPFAYRSHYEKDNTRTALRVGGKRDIARGPAPDSDEAYSAWLPDDSKPEQPRRLTEAAVVDPRNDNNAIVSQITLLFHLLHNTILDLLLEKEKCQQNFDPADQEAQMKRHFCARGALTLVYRNIIRRDLLKLLLHEKIYAHYKVERFFDPDTSHFDFIDKRAARPGGDARIPLEFAHAIFRFGHAMVRQHYRFNERTDGFPLAQVLKQNSSKNPSFMPLNDDWIIRWSYFFRFEGKTYNDQRPNLSRRIAPLFSPSFLSTELFPPFDKHQAGLAYRDLLGAEFLGLWSAQNVIDAIRAKRPELLEQSKLYTERDYAADLRAYLTTDAELMHLTNDVDRLVKKTPLGLFVLFEAAADPETQGKRLGLIGSIIVAEVILAAMVRDPVLGEAGAASLREAFERLSGQIYNGDKMRLEGIEDIASMEGLINFIAKNNNLTNEESKFI